MLDLYVDIDAHAAYPHALRAAQRHMLDLYVVTHDFLAPEANVHLVLAQEDQLNAGTWIGGNISRGDICITSDAKVASNCVLHGALALTPNGRRWNTGGGGEADRPNDASLTWPAASRTLAHRLEQAIVTARSVSSSSTAPPPRFSRLPQLQPSLRAAIG